MYLVAVWRPVFSLSINEYIDKLNSAYCFYGYLGNLMFILTFQLYFVCLQQVHYWFNPQHRQQKCSRKREVRLYVLPLGITSMLSWSGSWGNSRNYEEASLCQNKLILDDTLKLSSWNILQMLFPSTPWCSSLISYFSNRIPSVLGHR